MELKLEGILETLLVGAMAALVILAFVYFTFGHIWRVTVIQRFFNTLFAERRARIAPSVEPTEEPNGQRPVAKKRKPERPEPHFNFTHILLLALLYGLGVIAEGASHHLRRIDDSSVKRSSFDIVAHGQLRSGTALPWVAEFISDADACRTLEKSGSADKPMRLCKQIDERILEFFHNAKNSVLQSPEFNNELNALETRISFMRSFYALTWILMIELVVVVIIATIAEARYRWYPGRWRRWWRGRLLGDAAIKLGGHWVNIAALHCLLLLVGAVGLNFLCKKACDYWEDQFAKRIFGYYLSLTKAPPLDGDHEARREPLPRDVSPRSPYHVFSLADHDNPKEHHPAQRRFEPSAVRILGRSARVIVANHQGGQQPLWLFTLNDDGTELTNPDQLPVVLSGGVEDVQGLAVFEDEKPSNTSCYDPGNAIHVFALPPAFAAKSANEKSQLLSFCLDTSGSTSVVTELKAEEIPSPCPPKTQRSCTVEGLTVMADGRTFLFGIQSIDGKPEVAITRSTRGDYGWTGSELVFPGPKGTPASLTEEEKHGAVGISDLAAAPSGRVYVTLSRQRVPSGEKQAGPAPQGKSALADVGGSLWLVDLGCGPTAAAQVEKCGKQSANPLETFIHEPKGVATDNGSVLVVFDDETRRKSRQWAPVTFPLGQDESVFAVIPSPEVPLSKRAE